MKFNLIKRIEKMEQTYRSKTQDTCADIVFVDDRINESIDEAKSRFEKLNGRPCKSFAAFIHIINRTTLENRLS